MQQKVAAFSLSNRIEEDQYNMSEQHLAASSSRRIFHGWWIVAEFAITETIAYGVLYYAFSVFITPMEAELGWDRATLTGAFSLAMLVVGIFGVFVGWWVDRYGARLLMSVAAIAATLLLLAWASVQNIFMYYAIWVGIGLALSALDYGPSFTVIATWFTRRRGRALAFVTFAAGFASTIFLPLSNTLNELLGWRGAVAALAVLMGVIVFPLHALVLRRHPSDVGEHPDGETSPDQLPPERPKAKHFSVKKLLHQRAFWILTISFGAMGIAASGLRVHFVAYLIERDFTPAYAAFVSGLIGAMQVVGRILFAPLESRFNVRLITAGIFALQVLAFIVLLLPIGEPGILLFVVLFGASVGAMTLSGATLLAETYDTAFYGRISSLMSLFRVAFTTTAPVGVSLLYTLWGGYDRVWMLAILFPVAAMLLIGLLPKEKPKLG